MTEEEMIQRFRRAQAAFGVGDNSYANFGCHPEAGAFIVFDRDTGRALVICNSCGMLLQRLQVLRRFEMAVPVQGHGKAGQA